ncbi:Protein rax1 [Golovinomyces cichoracearum]|uniref:Protein rax1 n=1 Tax=Golovinomyces cichoracearum TaxID=62708 RepID=A0A420H6R6_9PEZI|nr:Protein rax1 [Golovinomyces cichoracearum]
MGRKDETSSPVPDLNRNRLPTLFEVLSRRTAAPVDLFFFYVYMRDQQRSVDYLDFWLDVAQHMSLCRHYVRELRRSVLISTPDGDRPASKRTSQILENLQNLNTDARGLSDEGNRTQDLQMSAFLRQNVAVEDEALDSPFSSEHSRLNKPRRTSSNSLSRPSFGMSNSQLLNSPSNSPEHSISRADIRQSAEKILYTFLLRGSEREIFLPDTIVDEITHSIEEHGRDDPEVFDAAKDYVFQAMERDAFPGFLRARALGNLIPSSLTFRLILGLFSLFSAFWVGFSLIFLNYSRRSRIWVSIPFTIGVYNLMAHQYRLDPLIALAGFSENTLMNFSRLRDVYVKRLLRKRAMTVLFIAIFLDLGLIILFVFVPGKRL